MVIEDQFVLQRRVRELQALGAVQFESCRRSLLFYLENFCTPAETPIWMGDYTFKPISEVEVGDTVMGWESRVGTRSKSGRPRRAMATATVARKIENPPQQVFKVTMESGRTLRCTAEHLWLTYPYSASNTQYREARVGVDLAHVTDLPGEVPAGLVRTAAWLGGIYDGEGCGTMIAQSEGHNPEILKAIQVALEALGFKWSPATSHGKVTGLHILGGRQEYIRFVNWCDPVKRRGLNRQGRDWIAGGSWFQRDKIVSIEPDGVEPVHALTTTTGNYVAWGYASKNCWTIDEHERDGAEKPLIHGVRLVDPLTLEAGRELDGSEDDFLRYIAAVWEREMLVAVPKSRQLRMSHLMMACHRWLGQFFPGQRIAIQSKKSEDADALLERCWDAMKIERKRYPHVPWPQATRKVGRILWPHGSLMMAIAQGPDKVRSYTFSAILSDEMAFQEEAEAAYTAAIPTVEGGGKYTGVSSANPGFFQKLVFDKTEVS